MVRLVVVVVIVEITFYYQMVIDPNHIFSRWQTYRSPDLAMLERHDDRPTAHHATVGQSVDEGASERRRGAESLQLASRTGGALFGGLVEMPSCSSSRTRMKIRELRPPAAAETDSGSTRRAPPSHAKAK